jgi:hypothetical protein
MNKTNIRRVATALLTGKLAEKKGVGYNQIPLFDTSGMRHDNSGHGCGTVACIAGHAAFLAGGKRAAKRGDAWDTAKKYLGLKDENMALELFNTNPLGPSDQPTAKQAALVLFHLAETGKVDWSVAV